jgi:hypothetical protein
LPEPSTEDRVGTRRDGTGLEPAVHAIKACRPLPRRPFVYAAPAHRVLVICGRPIAGLNSRRCPNPHMPSNSASRCTTTIAAVHRTQRRLARTQLSAYSGRREAPCGTALGALRASRSWPQDARIGANKMPQTAGLLTRSFLDDALGPHALAPAFSAAKTRRIRLARWA